MAGTPLDLLREALGNLAADPASQRQQFENALVTDELALDFEDALGAVESSDPEFEMNDVALLWLESLRDLLSAGPDESLWTEDLGSPAWSHIRRLASTALAEL